MASYWKSQPRHFCDFCKCWIADNKASKDFHERGKKHQDNVKTRINEVRKKSVRDEKNKEQMSDTLRQMEAAALRALKADLTEDPSMAGQYGVKIKPVGPEPEPMAAKLERLREEKQAKSDVSRTGSSTTPNPADKTTADTDGEWRAETTPEGYTYYWNVHTGASSWEKPVNYVEPTVETLPEKTPTAQPVPKSAPAAETVLEKTPEGSTEPGVSLSLGDIPLPTIVSNKKGASKKKKSGQNEEDGDSSSSSSEDEKSDNIVIERTPRPSRKSAYSAWETVQKVEIPEVDLQLPVDNKKYEEVVIPISEPKIKFNEKKVTSLASNWSNDPVAFKKRKMNSADKRRFKRREDDT